MRGTIGSVKPDDGYGFLWPLNSPKGTDGVFFHAHALRGGLEFGVGLLDRVVDFDLIQTDRGPRAVNVRPID